MRVPDVRWALAVAVASGQAALGACGGDEPEPPPRTSPSAALESSPVASSTSVGSASPRARAPVAAIEELKCHDLAGRALPAVAKELPPGLHARAPAGWPEEVWGPKLPPDAFAAKVKSDATDASFVVPAESARVMSACSVDVTGDGKPEVWLESWGGGAHCCYTEMFIEVTKAGMRPLETLELSDARIRRLVDDDHDGVLELVTDVSAYYESSCHVWAPLVLEYDGRRFADVTSRFPACARAAMKEELAVLDNPNVNGGRVCNAIAYGIFARSTGMSRAAVAAELRPRLDELEWEAYQSETARAAR